MSSESFSKSHKKSAFSESFSVITGGSKGMGKSIAKFLVQSGGNVLLVARTLSDLKVAQSECMQCRLHDRQLVEILDCDTTNFDSLKQKLTAKIDQYGTPDYLFNCVGYAYPQYVERLTPEDFRRNMDVNYYGQLYPILIVLPYFISRKKGHIISISSVMGYMGLMGYATYAPSKHALVGLMEVLRNELKPWNIHCSIVYPPDTDTPGFHEENKSKPPECAAISKAGKLLSPETVAKKIIVGVRYRRFGIYPGESKLISIIKRLFPRLIYLITDIQLKNEKKKLSKM